MLGRLREHFWNFNFEFYLVPGIWNFSQTFLFMNGHDRYMRLLHQFLTPALMKYFFQ